MAVQIRFEGNVGKSIRDCVANAASNESVGATTHAFIAWRCAYVKEGSLNDAHSRAALGEPARVLGVASAHIECVRGISVQFALAAILLFGDNEAPIDH